MEQEILASRELFDWAANPGEKIFTGFLPGIIYPEPNVIKNHGKIPFFLTR